MVVVLELLLDEPMFATWVPAKAKKRNMKVPTNSPIKATKSNQASVSWAVLGSAGKESGSLLSVAEGNGDLGKV